MYLRIFSIVVATGLLAACGSETPEPEGPSVSCAIGPGTELSDVCTLERVSDTQFLIHHPDGGFRRFAFDETGGDAAITVADGAEQLVYQRVDDQGGGVEFGLQTDRYRVDSSLLTQAAE